MQRITILLFVLTIIGIGGGAAWYLTKTSGKSLVHPPAQETPVPLTDSQGIYTNGPYGFAIFYPEAARIEYAFSPDYHLGTQWRAQALPESTGAAILAIIPYSIRNEASFPRYLNAMVRIGASEDPDEIERCERPSEDQGEEALPDVSIGGHVWKAFSFSDAGMMQYVSGISYRTLHEDRCIAMEQVRTGSSYREDVPSAADIPQETLDAEYAKLDAIVQSFSFAR